MKIADNAPEIAKRLAEIEKAKLEAIMGAPIEPVESARALNCMRFEQKHFIWFDMLPALKAYVGSVIDKFGQEEFARRARPYGLDVRFEDGPLVTAA